VSAQSILFARMATERTYCKAAEHSKACAAKTPDIKQLAVPSGKLHSSLPTAHPADTNILPYSVILFNLLANNYLLLYHFA